MCIRDRFSAALLKICNPNIAIQRGFAVPQGFAGLVFDIGDGPFDHHAKNSPVRENGVPYACLLYTSITMVKNENYWNVDSLAGPDTLQFTLMEEDAAQLTAFQSGELDFIDAVPNDEIDALSSTPEFYKEGQIGTYYVSYNVEAAPFDAPLVLSLIHI